ncbi:helix-turn-helix transcriptional regulator [Dactylosporangium vinaceum]|uniref:TetR/AcrR family transcriptional regulator n=1 Tax=Dactylosporangium vinaceum TaxID=53362 RepID=A0ABV5MIX6_9ACTN|nr:TetR/AcrR family transcriptional regulator [Dactylosporangium vinaceum]UAB93729.1 helix-turn-helix transcriptional regulator [Dactylosporangium vinaceum]
MTHPRPLRADARRNRDRLLEAALKAFSTEAAEEVTLEQVARDAGVGIGTLYRHFPTREALIEEVYRAELARLCESAPRLLATMSPPDALRAWMDAFIDYSAAKRGLAEALRTVIAAGGQPFAQSRTSMEAALRELLAAAADSGVRQDVEPYDVMVALNAVSLWVSEADRRDPAARVLDLLMDGLRYHG